MVFCFFYLILICPLLISYNYQLNKHYCISLVSLELFCSKPVSALIVGHTTGIFTPFCITPQAYSHHSASHHKHIHTILHHTTGIFPTFCIIPQAYSHHSASHHKHIPTILHHTTGIFQPYCIKPQAYPTTHTHAQAHANMHTQRGTHTHTHTRALRKVKNNVF